jgi:proteic killer suppression protein
MAATQHVTLAEPLINLPGYRLHPLKGDLKGFWAVTVQANWRVTFRLAEGDALDVDYVDYH